MLHLTEDNCRRLIKGVSIGTDWPYAEGNDNEIASYLKRVTAELARSATLLVEADFNHYGSGYASYVPLFCYLKDPASTVRRHETDYIEGILIYLSRLAPIAVWGPDSRTRSELGQAFSYLSIKTLYRPPIGNWIEQIHEIETKLRKFGFILPEQSELDQRLPFDAAIPTIITNPPYTLFDAIFYWED